MSINTCLATALPLEIVRYILQLSSASLDYSDRVQQLALFSLVCKSWCPATEEELYRHIQLSSYQGLFELQQDFRVTEVLRASEEKSAMVKVVEVCDSNLVDEEFLAAFETVLRCPNVVELRERWDYLPDEEHTLFLAVVEAVRPSLRILRCSSEGMRKPMQFFADCDTLEELDMLPTWPPSLSSSSPPPSLRLTRLSFVDGHGQGRNGTQRFHLDWLTPSSRLTLTHLSLPLFPCPHPARTFDLSAFVNLTSLDLIFSLDVNRTVRLPLILPGARAVLSSCHGLSSLRSIRLGPAERDDNSLKRAGMYGTLLPFIPPAVEELYATSCALFAVDLVVFLRAEKSSKLKEIRAPLPLPGVGMEEDQKEWDKAKEDVWQAARERGVQLTGKNWEKR
ncbi:hypothetical protein JCM8547_006511 [Rhodosporidiobolus lusitaniae]